MNGHRGWGRHLLLLSLGLGLVAAYVLLAEVDEVLVALRALSAGALAAAFAIAVAGWVPRLLSYHVLASNAGLGGWTMSLRACLGSNALNLVLPARLGDVSLVAALTRQRPVEIALSLVVHWRALSFLSLLLLVAATLLAAVQPFPAAFLWVLGATAVVGVLGASLFFAWGGRHLHRFLANAVERLHRRLQARGVLSPVERHVEAVTFGRFPVVFVAMAAATLAWLSEVGLAALVLRSIERVPLDVALLAALVASAARALRFTPGGIGLYEGAFAGVLLAYGLEPAPAVAAGALAGLLSNVVTLLLGAQAGASLLASGAGRTVDVVSRLRRPSPDDPQ